MSADDQRSQVPRRAPAVPTWAGPNAVAIVYTASAVLPLYLVAASAVRFQVEMGVTTSQLGYAVSCFFATGALASSRIGPLIDRIPARQSLRLGMSCSAASSVIVALIANTWWMIAIALAICGASHSVTQLGTNRVLAQRNGRRRALSFGAKQAAVPVASLAAGLGTALLGPVGMVTLLFLGAALMASLLGLFVPPIPEDRKGHDRISSARRTLRPLYRLALAAGLAAAAGNGLSILIVDSLDKQGVSERIAGIILAGGSVVAILTRTFAGAVVDRRESDGRAEFRTLLGVGALGFAGLAMAGGSFPATLMAAVVSFGAGWGWQGVVFYLASLRSGVPPATGSGIILSGTMGGSILGPLVIAVLAENVGYDYGWAVAACQLAVAALLVGPARLTENSPDLAR